MTNNQITEDQLKNIYNLAYLKQENTEKNLDSLKNIISLFEILEKLNFDNQNLSNISNKKQLNELRDDEAIKVDPFLKEICTNFNSETNRIKVPQVVEK